MISTILLIYIGVQIGAPWWYYTLLTIACLVKILKAGIDLGKKVGERTND